MALQYHSVQRPAATVNTSCGAFRPVFVRYLVTPELGPSSGVTEEWVEGGALAKLAKRFGSGRFLG
jgi:hypothetical protein